MAVERRDHIIRSSRSGNRKGEDPAGKTRSFDIPKRLVWEAYKRVAANTGKAAGVDGRSMADFQGSLEGNLYKLWSRMCSGSYMAPPVRRVEIPKPQGGTRPLGIPTVTDRIAQMVVKLALEPELERHFHVDSYGYRPGKSALDALGRARERCWQHDWVIDLDIKGFFDTIDHGLLLKALRRHTQLRWVLLYIERWLTADVVMSDGTRQQRAQGTPQGGVISPLLANLFLHYVFDRWMEKHHPHVAFERYADDVLCHCDSRAEAEGLLGVLRERFRACGLELHPQKTRLVYCKDDRRRGAYPETSFDFLGYTFRQRSVVNRRGELFIGFNPAVSRQALKAMNAQVRRWRINTQHQRTLPELAAWINPVVRGWVAYYGRFCRSALYRFLTRLNLRLIRWAGRKYRRFRRGTRRARAWLDRIRSASPDLFVHWQVLPAGRMAG